ncbi:MAG: ABC transporter substrate-binding protein, partial [Hyphomicrobiales bacterium]|nr:ABC transporter substrate-binding protein [Hyphomicrobiales bacterium]
MKQKLPLIACAVLAFWCLDARAEPSHGIAMHGEPAYAPGFEHLSYVRPDAPRGGNISHGVAGSFDSLNPLIVRGNAANGVRAWVYESLMARSYDEPFSLYGLLAETIETPEDRSWV